MCTCSLPFIPFESYSRLNYVRKMKENWEWKAQQEFRIKRKIQSSIDLTTFQKKKMEKLRNAEERGDLSFIYVVICMSTRHDQ